MKKKYKVYRFILYLILIMFLLINISYLLNQKGIVWDSAVYVGMSKYIFSSGKIGLWEPARPILLPILIGLFWKMGLDPIISASLVGIVFSSGCVWITYVIGKRVFNKNVALIAAFFLAFSPTFLFYSSAPLTGIISTFFVLLGIYFLLDSRYLLSGLFFGLGFVTRFLQLFALVAIIIVLLAYKKNGLKKIISLGSGFSIIVAPYLILNTIIYNNPIYPFLFQVFMSKNSGWIFNESVTFYLISLVNENFLIFFVLIGIAAVLMKKEFKGVAILTVLLFFLVFFNSIAHKETRFFLVFLPYLYLLTSYGAFVSLKFLKKKGVMFYLVIFVLALIWANQEIKGVKAPLPDGYGEFTEYLSGEDIGEGIWISNPSFILRSDKKADELIYYPIYNSKKIDELKKKLPMAKHILIDTCDILPCHPEDKLCEDKTDEFLDCIKNDFEVFLYKKEGICEQFIFRTTSLP
ncbi:MAG: glycosyltransferase family 39 protein [Nanoarchaeota archaeon]|nr:glycosyltransferase family 39 protein [Nanoarchaeota archaeon]